MQQKKNKRVNNNIMMSQRTASTSNSTTTKCKRRTCAVSTTTAAAALASPTAAILLLRGVSASNSTFANSNSTTYNEEVIVSPTPLPAPINIANATLAPTTLAPTSKPTRLTIKSIGNNGNPEQVYPLGTCLGDCDNDGECEQGLICFQRDPYEPVPGCNGGEVDGTRMDVCIPPPVYTSSPTVSASPSSQPSISSSPTLSNVPSQQPSFEPTASPTIPASDPVRLRLYWQRNYMWQESRSEKFWCMQCRSRSCKKNAVMEIDYCSSRSSAQKFKYYKDRTIRPMTDPSLCFEENGWDFETNPIKLRPCNGSSKQRFTGFRDDRRPFEFKSGRNRNYCVTQAHHPKAHERIFPQICRRARNHYTNKWVVY